MCSFGPLLGSFNPLCLPLSSQVDLELCEHPKHIEESFASGVTGINRLFGCLKVYTPLLQIVGDVLQVTKRTREPINTGNDKGVATSDKLQGSLELLSGLPSGSACLLFEDFIAASD